MLSMLQCKAAVMFLLNIQLPFAHPANKISWALRTLSSDLSACRKLMNDRRTQHNPSPWSRKSLAFPSPKNTRCPKTHPGINTHKHTRLLCTHPKHPGEMLMRSTKPPSKFVQPDFMHKKVLRTQNFGKPKRPPSSFSIIDDDLYTTSKKRY